MEEYTVKVNTAGTREWYQNGKRHRLDGPAIEWSISGKEWSYGGKEWYQNGKLHREDGPAVELANGDKAWHIEGRKLTEEEFNNRNKVEVTLEDIAEAMNIDVKKLRIKEH